ncbi:MAG: DUF4397 domain-containing protein [Lachnospiraceae bacterium]|jgi:hypothetical protein|nr:DUF4397 domain-containing protein [Lachnospiraceae bacterium]NBJ80392.1 DUF4397 domain-containing protein [bacterium 1XD42-76]NBK03601.1 DUF4397 domain-containing protein [bacterium 1XD42-94]
MYIDKNGLNVSSSVSENTDIAHITEAGSPGFAPISPDTPSWGPPSGSGGNDSPGYFPISPDTPSWGPPSGSGGNNSPGYFPISPDTPSWGPPSGSGGNNNSVIIIPGQGGCINCGSGSSNQNASVRFLHAAVNQPALTVRLGNRTVINNMQFGNYTPYYLENSSQSTLVTVTNSQTGRTLFQRYINFSGQNTYTVSIINDGSGITLFTLTDSPCNYRNSACLRAVNLSPNSGAVDIFLSGYGRLFQNVGRLDVTGYSSVRQGTYQFSVSEALPCSNGSSIIIGSSYVECNNTRIVIMDSKTLNVMNGVTYTLYVIGLAYQFPSLQLLPLESDLIY